METHRYVSKCLHIFKKKNLFYKLQPLTWVCGLMLSISFLHCSFYINRLTSNQTCVCEVVQLRLTL